MAAAGSDNRFVKTLMMVKPELRLAAAALKKGESWGQSLDASAFEMGTLVAPLAEQVVMLPLDLIGVGEVAQGAMATMRAAGRATVKFGAKARRRLCRRWCARVCTRRRWRWGRACTRWWNRR